MSNTVAAPVSTSVKAPSVSEEQLQNILDRLDSQDAEISQLRLDRQNDSVEYSAKLAEVKALAEGDKNAAILKLKEKHSEDLKGITEEAQKAIGQSQAVGREEGLKEKEAELKKVLDERPIWKSPAVQMGTAGVVGIGVGIGIAQLFGGGDQPPTELP